MSYEKKSFILLTIKTGGGKVAAQISVIKINKKRHSLTFTKLKLKD